MGSEVCADSIHLHVVHYVAGYHSISKLVIRFIISINTVITTRVRDGRSTKVVCLCCFIVRGFYPGDRETCT